MRIPQGGIGVFDSGIGGLTVLSECQKLCKNETFYYFGDHAHAPYGNKSPKRIYRYTLAAMRKFRRLKVKAVVLACNTVTAVCVEKLRRKFSFPIIGTEPAIYPAAKSGGLVYVLSTKATNESARFQNLKSKLAKLCPQSSIESFACEGLAGEIERAMGTEFDYAAHLPRGKPDAVVLGCTHYIYIKEKIESFYGCKTYDGNQGIAKRLSFIIAKTEILPTKKKKNRVLRPRLTTECRIVKKLNKKTQKTSQKSSKIRDKQTLFFLGKSRDRMHFIHKQMFAFYENG